MKLPAAAQRAVKLTDLQRRALTLLAEPGAICQQGFTGYRVNSGQGVAASTIRSLVDRKLLRYSLGEFTITDTGRDALRRQPS